MTLWLIFAVGVVLVLVFLARIAPSAKVRLADLPDIFEKTRNGKDPSFAALAFIPTGGKAKDDAINIQFSRDDGRMGVDWFLLAPRNIREKTEFIDFARGRGHQPFEKQAPNGSKYVRVEDGDLAALMAAVLRERYAVTPDFFMDLIYEGFDWRKSTAEKV